MRVQGLLYEHWWRFGELVLNKNSIPDCDKIEILAASILLSYSSDFFFEFYFVGKNCKQTKSNFRDATFKQEIWI